jgi:hypothetical protein
MYYNSRFTETIKRLCLILLVTLPSVVFSAVIEVGPGKTYATPEAAALVANPGDTILIFPSIYSAGNFISNLHGNENQYIYFIGVDPETVIFAGGTEGLHFSDISYIHIEGLRFTGHTGNGMNIDDGGTFDTPTHHVRVINCHFYDMGAQGNNDFLKMSGVDQFWVSECSFVNAADGGSGIDMVGCHDGKIEKCTFKDMGSNSIQAKGGTQFIEITQNWFEDGGQRALNLGGSTGLQFFRPQNATFEAADLDVYANVFIRGWAPIAYVGCVRVHVVNNTIIDPENWVMRILQETVDINRFSPCGDNSFTNNIVYFDNTLSTSVNIGPNTNAPSFAFKNNLWYNYVNPSNSTPNLPTTETNRIAGLDPLFVDASTFDYALSENSPAVDKGTETIYTTDFNGSIVPQGLSIDIGAYELGMISSLNIASSRNEVLVYPMPCTTHCFIESDQNEIKTLAVYDANGRQVTHQVKINQVGEQVIKLNLEQLKPGIYYLVASGFSRKIVKI